MRSGAVVVLLATGLIVALARGAITGSVSQSSAPTGVVVAGGSLPATVALQAIDGGSNYYCSNDFTEACNAGWDSLSFFPIMQDYYYCAEPASEWTGAGLNGAIRVNYFGSSDCTASNFGQTLQGSHLFAIPGGDNFTGNVSTGYGPETVGWHIEEPSSWSSITSAANRYGGFSTGGVTGRFLQVSFTANQFPHAGGLPNISGFPSQCGSATMRDVTSCTSGMPSGRHIDVVSADSYWFAGSDGPAPFYSGFCTALYGGGSCDSDQVGRGSNYGDMIDAMRAWTPAPHVPSAAYIETGNGLVGGGRSITPPEFNWAAWDTIVHGARMLLYFTISSASSSAGFPTTSVDGTTMYAQAHATDGLLEGLAPIINSPFALSFASDSAGGYVFPTEHLVLDNGLDVMTKYYTGSPFKNSAGSFGPGFYIFAAVRGSEAQAMPAKVTFTLPSDDTTATGPIQDVCGCSPTQATGTANYDASTHSFTETFNKTTDVHIIGPFQ